MEKINIFAVAVASLIPMVVGAIWYSPPVFARKWMALIGKTEEELKKSADPIRMYGGTFIASFVMSYILAHFVIYANSFTGNSGFGAGMVVGTVPSAFHTAACTPPPDRTFLPCRLSTVSSTSFECST